MQTRAFRFYPPVINITIFAFMVAGLLSANPLISTIALAVLILLPRLTWLNGHPPVILLCLIFQWLQASTKILQANILEQTLSFYNESQMAFNSVLYSLLGVVVLALGTHLIIRKTAHVNLFKANNIPINLNKAFRLFFIFFIASAGLSLMVFVVPGLTQILLSVTYLKWVVYSLLFLTILQRREKYPYLFIIFFIELLYNSLGFYSNFKEVLLVTFILMGTFVKKVAPIQFLLGLIIVFVTFNMFTIWTGIKGDYRFFLLQDTEAGFTEKISKISTLYDNFDDYEAAVEQGLDRLSYTNMLMYCMETVPDEVPHEKGKLWASAVSHVLMPRILFPTKRVLNDSEKANAYTGRSWTGVEKGTSISIGYVSESYVDFGKFGMFIPIFILGLLVGLIYNFFLSANYPPIILFSIVIPAIYFTKFNLLENSNDKLLGAMIMNFIVFSIFMRYGLKPILRYLQNGQ